MTELKTLKDLVETKDHCSTWETIGFADEKELKEEAIKWIKELKRVDRHFSKIDIKYRKCCRNSTMNWIKHFFNITEDDLK